MDGPNVLIVEPDTALGSALAAYLRQQSGYAVRVAGDGLNAIFMVEDELPDVIVLNLDVSAVSGYRLIRLFKQDALTAGVPVVVLSDVSFEESWDAILAGADAFLVKPVDAGVVADRVQQVMARAGKKQEAGALVAA
jgi:DNA-binding response OmpR family regulator